MKNFVIGALVGTLLTFLLMHLAVQDTAAPIQALPASQPRASSSEVSLSDKGAMPSPSRVTSSAAALPNGAEKAAHVEVPAQSTPGDVAVSTPTSASVPAGNLSAAHAHLLEQPDPGHAGPSALASAHQNFASQSRDEAWASAAEQNLNRYLSQVAQPPEFNVASVECRNDLCEIQAYGYTNAAANKWNVLVADMSQQPWWYLFSGNTGSSSSTNGQAVILTILHRGST